MNSNSSFSTKAVATVLTGIGIAVAAAGKVASESKGIPNPEADVMIQSGVDQIKNIWGMR